VEHDFVRLFSLFVADRLKAVSTAVSYCSCNLVANICRLRLICFNKPKLAYICDKIACMANVYHATHTYV